MDHESDDEPSRLSIWQLLGSAVAAAFGVQSRRNRERDFRSGKPLQFVIVGVILTGSFVLLVIAVVRLVLATAG